MYIGELRFDVFHNKRLFSPRRNCGTTIVTKPSPKGYKKFSLHVIQSNTKRFFYFLKVLTVYLALHTGEFVVKIFSALRGLIISKILTVQSWLDDANWFCWKGHQSKPCIWNYFHFNTFTTNLANKSNKVTFVRWAVMYCTGLFAFRWSHILMSPSCAVAKVWGDNGFQRTWDDPAAMNRSIIYLVFTKQCIIHVFWSYQLRTKTDMAFSDLLCPRCG